MGMVCTRCQGYGWLNMDQVPDDERYFLDSPEAIGEWADRNQDHDVQICDCCGDGDGWYGEPGEHYNGEQHEGAYDYNGGLCECH